MPSVFRPTIISYHLPNGKRVPKGTPGSRKKKCRTPKWYGRFWDHKGKRLTVPLFTDKGKSQQRLNELSDQEAEIQSVMEGKDKAVEKLLSRVSRAVLVKEGIVDPFAEHNKRSLSEHAKDFGTYLASKKNTTGHVTATVSNIQRIIRDLNIRVSADLAAEGVVEYLQSRRDGGMSVGTSNHYLRSIKSFTNWLVKAKRTADDPLIAESALNTEIDRRRERRVLSSEEFTVLLEAAKAGQPWRYLDGYSRYVLYLVAASTGFRANELASSTRESFDLDSDHPTVTLKAGYSKRRREDVQPLPLDVIPILREFLDSRPPEVERIWPGTWADRASDMLQVDMAEGRKRWIEAAAPNERAKREASDFLAFRDKAGLYFDFHALRGQFITSLSQSGVHPKVAQELARHSSIDLTMNYYTHLTLKDLAGAVNSVRLPIPKPEQRTGTTG